MNIKILKQRFWLTILTGIVILPSLVSADDFVSLEDENFIETESNVIILDSDNDSTTSINLQFGETLNKNLSFDIVSNWFNLNDSLEISGSLSLQGNLNLNKNQAENFVFENLATAPSNPVAGQTYYNTNDNNTYFWDGTAWKNIVTEGSGATPPALQVRRASNFTLPSPNVWYDIPFTLTDVESNSTVLEHNNSDTARIDIKENGLYKITYQIDAVDNAENHRLETQVELNWTTQVNGSFMVNYDYQAEHVPHSGIFLSYFNANDYIKFQAQRLTANEIINETTLTIVKLETWAQGPKGDKGDPGTPWGGIVANVFYAYDSTGGQSITGTELTLNLDTAVVSDSNYTLAADQLTFNATWLYKITANTTIEVTNTSWWTRWDCELTVQENTGSGYADIPWARSGSYIRETTDRSSSSTTFIRPFNAGDSIRVRLNRISSSININTLQNASSLTIEQIR